MFINIPLLGVDADVPDESLDNTSPFALWIDLEGTLA
jgi:hypothetical protein